MNQQRQTIYSLRRRVLAAGAGVPLVEFTEDKKTRVKTRSEKTVSWADFKEMVLDALEDTIVNLTDTYCTGSPANWNLEGLSIEIKGLFDLDMAFQNDGKVEDIQNQIYQKVERIYLDREKDFNEEWHNFCQQRYLFTIDQLWKEHLLSMDHLRQGIGLRGYGQKDPKLEYKKEGYAGFLRMLQAIKTNFIREIIRAQPRNAQEDADRIRRAMEARARQAVESRPPAEGDDAKAPAAVQKTVVRDGPKIGRNDPCYCGSGKKYKKCHGAEELAR
jgi:preprotein translocase subunit SecA